VEKFLSYDHMLQVCEELNEKHLPKLNDDAFSNTIDEVLNRIDLDAMDVLQLAYEKLLQTVDSEITKLEDATSITPSCFKGCAHCCYFPIITSQLEGKLLARKILSFPEERKADILAHLKQYFETYENNEVFSIDFQNEPDFKKQYISKQVPCPLLDTKTNMCKAYEVRPIPCRTYLNYSNPSVCNDTLIPKETFSYEFFGEFYSNALNEVIQTLLYEGEDLPKLNYPKDIIEYDYLPNLLKRELDL
jgi:uncharacterized protein